MVNLKKYIYKKRMSVMDYSKEKDIPILGMMDMAKKKKKNYFGY